MINLFDLIHSRNFTNVCIITSLRKLDIKFRHSTQSTKQCNEEVFTKLICLNNISHFGKNATIQYWCLPPLNLHNAIHSTSEKMYKLIEL